MDLINGFKLWNVHATSCKKYEHTCESKKVSDFINFSNDNNTKLIL